MALSLVVAACGTSTDSPAAPGVDVPPTLPGAPSSTVPESSPEQGTVTTEPVEDASTAPAPTTGETVEVLPPAEPPPAQPLPTSWPILRRGDDGPWVVMLQEQLRRHGCEIEVDGTFGPATEAAVLGFQTAHGLETDGLCGPNTWAALIHGEVLPVVVHAGPMQLRADGLGAFDFGSDAPPVVTALTAELGTPTSDATYQASFSCGDAWCDGRERTLQWQSVGGARFTARFLATIGEFELAGWRLDGYGGLTGIDLATRAGITLGSTAADVLAAYPDVDFGFWPEQACGDAWWSPTTFRVGDPGESYGFDGLRGSVHAEDPYAPLERAVVDLGFPDGLRCMYDVMCSQLFATVQQMLGLPVTHSLDRATWVALGLPLPPDQAALVTALTAGDASEGC